MFPISHTSRKQLREVPAGHLFVMNAQGPTFAIRAVDTRPDVTAAVLFRDGTLPSLLWIPPGGRTNHACLDLGSPAHITIDGLLAVTLNEAGYVAGNLAICGTRRCLIADDPEGNRIWIDIANGQIGGREDCWFVPSWQLGLLDIDGRFQALYTGGAKDATPTMSA